MSKNCKLGLAGIAASFFLQACGTVSSPVENSIQAPAEARIHCGGVNSCKGQTACRSANNSCKGQNNCKGEGWLYLTKEDCEAKGGAVLM